MGAFNTMVDWGPELQDRGVSPPGCHLLLVWPARSQEGFRPKYDPKLNERTEAHRGKRQRDGRVVHESIGNLGTVDRDECVGGFNPKFGEMSIVHRLFITLTFKMSLTLRAAGNNCANGLFASIHDVQLMTSSRAELLGKMMEVQVEHRGGSVIIWTPGILDYKKFCWSHNRRNMWRTTRFLDDYFRTWDSNNDGTPRARFPHPDPESRGGLYQNIHLFFEKCRFYLNSARKCDKRLPATEVELEAALDRDMAHVRGYWDLTEKERKLAVNKKAVWDSLEMKYIWKLMFGGPEGIFQKGWTLEVQGHLWMTLTVGTASTTSKY